jgi:ribulose-5-phosphate 4-epimerase/fuculose-1-phosphate aldolase
MGIDERWLKQQIVRIGQRLQHRRLLRDCGGSISHRVATNEFLVTRSMSNLGFLTGEAAEILYVLEASEKIG